MKTYTTSDELALALFKNGFVETTHKDYPEKKGAKRSFLLRGKRLSFIFDYITIVVTLGNSHIFRDLSISEAQLRAILAYYQLPSVDRSNWIQNHGKFNLIEICEVIEEMEVGDHWYRRSFYTRLKNAYIGVAIEVM